MSNDRMPARRGGVAEIAPLAEDDLPALLDAAVTGAEPGEVMPPVLGETGWTEAQRAGFLAFHRARSLDPVRRVDETYVVRCAGVAVGAVRLERRGTEAEIGIWLARQARGRGLAAQAVRQLCAIAMATGATRVVAHTTADNAASRALLRAVGARLHRHGDAIEAVLAQ